MSEKYIYYSIGASIILFGILKISEFSLRRQLKRISFAAYTPDELIDILSKKTLKNQKEISIKNIGIKGFVSSKNPILSDNKKDKLLYKEIIRRPLDSNSFIFTNSSSPPPIFKFSGSNKLYEECAIMEIYDPLNENNKQTCYIPQDSIKNIKESLELTNEKIIKMDDQITFIQRIFAFILFGIESILVFFSPKHLLNGVIIGYSDCEYGLKSDGPLSFLGNAIYNTNTKEFRFEKGVKLFKSREIIINSLESKIQFLKNIDKFIILYLFGFSIYLVINQYQKTKILRNKKLNGKKSNSYSKENIEKKIKNLDENTLCLICFENQRSILFKPCLHLCLCEKCYKLMKRKKCPVCRSNIIDYEEILADEKKYLK